ncbi:hypothetical protein NG829_00235 [Xanthomonas sacchari]|uniref:hypothetical protein n=1 Tax=Xanthomonas sacchari TaxID=56458 RepID=UPI00225E6DFF|nr:hypothetical protein [Xanthomonas sacchari]UYK80796.1 hypothetical protein NG829_00235 [Xanthomonas sacchari]
MLYKGSIYPRPPFSELVGIFLNIRIAIDDLLKEIFPEAERKCRYQKVDASFHKCLSQIKLIRDVIAHESINNYQNSLVEIIDLCEKFVANVQLSFPPQWQNSQSRGRLSPLELAGQALFDAILDFYNPQLRRGMVLDGLYPPGQKTLAERADDLLLRPIQ